MSGPPPTQRIIACIWDFDGTLIPGNQQEPLFAEYGVDPDAFWSEVEGLPEYHRARGEVISRDTAYLHHILTYVEAGIFPGLTNARLRELGARLVPSPGMPGFLEAARRHLADGFSAHGVSLEHYVVSNGIQEMIEGSPLAPYLDGIWANTFLEGAAPPGYQGEPDAGAAPGPIRRIGYSIDNTTKTRAVFEINKGVNRDPAIDVNAPLPEGERRVPLRHMVYVADGPSDVPVFSVLNQLGGRTLGVYTAGPRSNFRQVKDLREQGRIQGMAEADFRPGRAACRWLLDALDQIASGIVAARRAASPGASRPAGRG